MVVQSSGAAHCWFLRHHLFGVATAIAFITLAHARRLNVWYALNVWIQHMRQTHVLCQLKEILGSTLFNRRRHTHTFRYRHTRLYYTHMSASCLCEHLHCTSSCAFTTDACISSSGVCVKINEFDDKRNRVAAISNRCVVFGMLLILYSIRLIN